MRRCSVADAYDNLIDAFDRLYVETGVEVMSIRFNRDDVPVDWNEEAQRWEREGANG